MLIILNIQYKIPLSLLACFDIKKYPYDYQYFDINDIHYYKKTAWNYLFPLSLYFFGLIISNPPIYGLKTSGIVTLPSSL
jgi:hypothetical protein